MINTPRKPVEDKFARERYTFRFARKYIDEKLKELRAYIDTLPAKEVITVQEKSVPVDEIVSKILDILPKNEPVNIINEDTQIVENSISKEEIAALIEQEIKKAQEEFVTTGDTIVINEAPQRIVEKIKETISVVQSEVDYSVIYAEIQKMLNSVLPALYRPNLSSIRAITDVNLNGVPQDSHGNFLFGQLGGASEQTFESVSKNLKTYPYTLIYTTGVLTSIEYNTGSGVITKSFNYTGSDLTSVVLSGDIPAGLAETTKTLSYTGGILTGIAYS